MFPNTARVEFQNSIGLLKKTRVPKKHIISIESLIASIKRAIIFTKVPTLSNEQIDKFNKVKHHDEQLELLFNLPQLDVINVEIKYTSILEILKESKTPCIICYTVGFYYHCFSFINGEIYDTFQQLTQAYMLKRLKIDIINLKL